MRFSAEKYYALGMSFGELNHQFKTINVNNQRTVDLFSKFFEDQAATCEEIGLTVAASIARKAIGEIKDLTTVDPIRQNLKSLSSVIHSEMEQNIFLRVRPEMRRYFEQMEPVFGKSVESQFPSALIDISEAAKCLALERWTACVYHSMGVLEHGLRALAKKFAIPFDDKTWNDVLEPLEKAIRNIKAAPKKPKGWKRNEQFYSEAAAQFMHFKNAWRNYTAHGKVKFNDVEAEAIFRHVGDFMCHLSKRLKEGKRK
jgi:hypothetical protein